MGDNNQKDSVMLFLGNLAHAFIMDEGDKHTRIERVFGPNSKASFEDIVANLKLRKRSLEKLLADRKAELKKLLATIESDAQELGKINSALEQLKTIKL